MKCKHDYIEIEVSNWSGQKPDSVKSCKKCGYTRVLYINATAETVTVNATICIQ